MTHATKAGVRHTGISPNTSHRWVVGLSSPQMREDQIDFVMILDGHIRAAINSGKVPLLIGGEDRQEAILEQQRSMYRSDAPARDSSAGDRT